MTPRDALAAALHHENCALRGVGSRQCRFWQPHQRSADAILAALAADGFTVAPVQDPLERMAELTVPQGFTFDVVPEVARGALYGWTVRVYGPSSIVASATRRTIAAAADAAREAIGPDRDYGPCGRCGEPFVASIHDPNDERGHGDAAHDFELARLEAPDA